ncbi:MFS transporter [Marinimicrobium sp. ARAG 43.8]|uniref:MFS transporter n=1 Tax=Marinimicrobium sp. ARAG 43.8 TaxID=3418719 RepID=UPI003CE741AF
MSAAYILAGILLALTQGLGMSFISGNIREIAGPMGLTQQEATWLIAAYVFPNASLTLLLFKVRAQYGLRRFAEITIVVYVLVCLAHLWVDGYQSALIMRFFAGVAAAPMTSLGFLYILESIPPEKKLNVGLCIALTAMALGLPLSGLISPALLESGNPQVLYLMELGLAMIALGLVYAFPLTSPPRRKVISKLDVLSFLFLAMALGTFASVLTVGRGYWWTTTNWLGIWLIAGIAAAIIFAVIELHREEPLVDVRWITSREILHFIGALMVFRIVLSEQSGGAINFMRNAGLLNEQIGGLYLVMIIATIVSGALCAVIMKPGREPALHAVALLMIAVGSYMDSQSTILTRPEQMYVSQALISFAGGLFLPPALAIGLNSALKRGPNYILSFIVVFLTTQKVGGYLGSALYSTFVQWREQLHSARLATQLNTTSPLVSQRIEALGYSYQGVVQPGSEQSTLGANLLAQQVQQQAYVLAYNDSFLLTGALCVLALIWLSLHVLWRHRHQWLPHRLQAAHG